LPARASRRAVAHLAGSDSGDAAARPMETTLPAGGARENVSPFMA